MTQETTPTSPRPVAAPIILLLVSAAHLAHAPIADLRGFPILVPALSVSTLLAVGYAIAAWQARHERGFALAVKLILLEDVGILAAGFLFGYPWAEYLRAGTVAIIPLQLALAFAEIVRRQEAGRPIVPATRLAWFVLAYAAILAAYSLLRPTGLWKLASIASLVFA